jgi:hypothetical protein
VLKLVLSVLRFSYDAWIVYSFFSPCLAWVGGPGAVVVFLLASNYAYRRGLKLVHLVAFLLITNVFVQL